MQLRVGISKRKTVTNIKSMFLLSLKKIRQIFFESFIFFQYRPELLRRGWYLKNRKDCFEITLLNFEQKTKQNFYAMSLHKRLPYHRFHILPCLWYVILPCFWYFALFNQNTEYISSLLTNQNKYFA